MYIHPLKWVVANGWKEGNLSLWNPYIYCGVPLSSDIQVSPFHPLNLIFCFLPFDQAYNYLIILHFFLSGIFTFIFLKGEGLSESASFIGGIVFAFNCYYISVIGCSIFFSIFHIPLTLFLFSRAIEEKNIRKKSIYIASSGIAIGLQFLSGDPENLHFTIIILLFISAIKNQNVGIKQRIKNIIIVFTSVGFIGLLFSAIQLIPTLELLKFTERSAGVEYNKAVLWSFHPIRIISFFVPYFFGKLTPVDTYWGVAFENGLYKSPYSFVQTSYCGIFALILTISILLSNKCRKVILWGFIGVFFLLISFGKYFPLYYLLYKFIPFFNIYRYPIKAILIVSFAIAVLSAFGWDYFFESKNPLKILMKTSIIITSLIIILILVLFLFGDFISALISNSKWIKDSIIPSDSIISVIKLESIKILLFLFIGTTLVIIGCAKFSKFSLVKFLFFVLILFDILYFARQCNFTTDYNIYNDEPTALKLLKSIEKREAYTYRVYIDDIDKGNFWSKYIKDNQEKIQSGKFSPFELRIWWKKDTLHSNLGIKRGIFYGNGYLSYTLSNLDKLVKYSLSERDFSRLFSLLNIKYVIASYSPNESYKFSNFSTVAIEPSKNIRILRNDNVLPRIYWVNESMFSKNNESIENLFGDDFEKNIQEIINYNTQHSIIKVLSYKDNCIKVFVNAPLDGYLIVNDTYYPGWKAKVDGANVDIIRANIIMKAIHLKKGQHNVIMNYSSTLVKLGAVITIFTFTSIVSMIIFLLKFRRCDTF